MYEKRESMNVVGEARHWHKAFFFLKKKKKTESLEWWNRVDSLSIGDRVD